MAQSRRSLLASVCKIRKEVPGNLLATAGSACVVEWPWEIEGGQASLIDREDKIFIACLSQVVSKSELSSSKVCSADFLPLKWGRTETFRLNDVPLQDAQLSCESKDISLTLIPVNPLHKQKVFSRLRKNQFLCDRPQHCNRGSKSEIPEAKPDKLFCYVLRENAPGDTFDLQCYLLELDENGSYYLQVHGNKADLKRLKDFDRYEYPVGSVILDGQGQVVGFLAFGENDEILPLFILPYNQQDCTSGNQEQLEQARLTEDLPEGSESTEINEGCTNRDESESSQTNTTTPVGAHEDVNKKKEENPTPDNNLNNINATNAALTSGPSVTLNQQKEDEIQSARDRNQEGFEPSSPDQDKGTLTKTENSSDILTLLKNLVIETELSRESSNSSQRSRPTEMSFSSYDGDGSEIHDTGDDEEEDFCSILTIQGGDQRSSRQGRNYSDEADNRLNGQQAKKPPIQRSQSEQNEESLLKAKKTLFKLQSVPCGPSHSGSASLVKDQFLNRANVMDVLSLHLDRSKCPGKREEIGSPGWEQLADEFKVPEKIKSKCQNFRSGNLSPSEAMFDHLESTNDSLTIEAIKTHLKKLGRGDIIGDINEVMGKDSDLSADTTLTDLWNMHPEALWTVCLRLDDQRNLKNWMDLGYELDLSRATLLKFRDPSGNSPTQLILEKVKTVKPTLPITEIQAVLEELNLEPVARKLNHLRDGDIRTLLREIEVLEDVTGVLDLEERSWRRFALQLYEFSDSVLDNFRPHPISSPTKVVMNYIVQENPELTVRSFLLVLKNMERNDLILDLKGFFKPGEIDEILG